jgi:hypothetical protein
MFGRVDEATFVDVSGQPEAKLHVIISTQRDIRHIRGQWLVTAYENNLGRGALSFVSCFH